MNLTKNPNKPKDFNLSENTAAKLFKGSAPRVEWLVERILPTGKLVLLASPPGVGKSFLALNLAVAVSSPPTNDAARFCFGGKVLSHGKVVIVSAEDDHAELHRRLETIGRGMPHDLHIHSMPDFGHFSIMKSDVNHEYRDHPDWTVLKQQIIELGNVKLIIFDTLQSMTVGDLNAAEVAQYAMNELAELASITSAAVIAIHHLKKSSSQEKKEVLSAYAAMESIRGSGAITGAARAAYCLFPHPKGPDICSTLGIPYEENKVVYGLIAKSNGDARRDYSIYVRNEVGLLIDETLKIKRVSQSDYSLLIEELFTEIKKAHEEQNGYSASLSSSSGLHKRRDEMPCQFHALSSTTFGRMVEELLSMGKIERKRVTNGYKWAPTALPEESANAQCPNA